MPQFPRHRNRPALTPRQLRASRRPPTPETHPPAPHHSSRVRPKASRHKLPPPHRRDISLRSISPMHFHKIRPRPHPIVPPHRISKIRRFAEPASSPAHDRTRDPIPSAPTIHRARTNASSPPAPPSRAKFTPSREIPITGVFHSNSTPQLIARSTNFACSATRRIPIPHSPGNRAATSLPRPINRTPRITCPSPSPTLTPNSLSAATVSGINPSPHAFSIGHAPRPPPPRESLSSAQQSQPQAQPDLRRSQTRQFARSFRLSSGIAHHAPCCVVHERCPDRSRAG